MPKRLEDNTIEILRVKVSRLGFEGAIAACLERSHQYQGGYVCFVNVHSTTESVRSLPLQKCLNGAFLSVADGMPLVWVSKLKGQPIVSRVCGPDFMREFLKQGKDLSHGFLGGQPGLALELAQRFGFPSSPCYSPPMRPFSNENAAQDWAEYLKLCPDQKAPSIVWVGLGAPKQELWMEAVAPLAPQTLFMGVGAAFDFLTDKKKRAPVWMQNSGLEWLFRLFQEPRRLWKRYLVNNLLFIYDLIRNKSQHRK